MTDVLRVLVLEDEWASRNHLVSLLEAKGAAEVVGGVESIDEARAILAACLVDVAFVDVRLPGSGASGDGLDLIRGMAAEPTAPLFVLATAFPQHGLEAFELGVADYLLKPFTQERVDECLRRLATRVEARPQTTRRRVVARRKRSLLFLEPSEIWAFEAADRMTFVHSSEGKFDIDLSLAAIEASFGRALFRVHRNWLVNLTFVREFERDTAGTTVILGCAPQAAEAPRTLRAPVSQDRSKALRTALLETATGLRRT